MIMCGDIANAKWTGTGAWKLAANRHNIAYSAKIQVVTLSAIATVPSSY
jgi:hypothetical protein